MSEVPLYGLRLWMSQLRAHGFSELDLMFPCA